MTPKILLIDDDDSLRTLLGITLRNWGHEVLEARNGRDALELNRVEPADVVITDIVMPEMEGLETIGLLRTENPGLKIVAMSGGGQLSTGSYLAAAQHFGANCTLPKPFSNDELATALAELSPA